MYARIINESQNDNHNKQTCCSKSLLLQQTQIKVVKPSSSGSICWCWQAAIRLIQVQIAPMMIHCHSLSQTNIRQQLLWHYPSQYKIKITLVITHSISSTTLRSSQQGYNCYFQFLTESSKYKERQWHCSVYLIELKTAVSISSTSTQYYISKLSMEMYTSVVCAIHPRTFYAYINVFAYI